MDMRDSIRVAIDCHAARQPGRFALLGSAHTQVHRLAMSMHLAGGARRRGALLFSLTALTLAAVPTPVRASPPATVAALARLSNLRTVSRWAYPSSEAPVHARSSAGSRVIGHLRFLTDDDQAELYLALDSARMSSGQTWIKIELPARPNGQTGWVASSAL